MAQLVLSLDTSTPTLSTALLERNPGGLRVVGVREAAPPAVTSTLVPGLFQELLDEAGATLADVSVLVAGTGPGLFTGTRVAVATMKAVAYARQLPLLGAQSLQAMALAAARGRVLAKGDAIAFGEPVAPGTFCAILDARKGEVYAGAYRFEGTKPVEVLAPVAEPPAKLVERLVALSPSPTLFGTGVKAPQAAWPAGLPIADSPLFPGACELAWLALEATPEPAWDLAHVLALEPWYLRPPEAEVAKKKRDEAARRSS